MFDATKLLGGFLQGRQPGGGSGFQSGQPQQGGLGGMVQQALSQFVGGRSANGLGGLLSQFTGPSQAGQGGGMLDQVRDMATRAVNAPGAELRGNNPAAVGGLGALAGALMGGGRGAVGGGLLAVLGSLAYAAYQKQGTDPVAAAANPAASPWGQGARPVIAPALPGHGDQAVPGYADPEEVQRKAALVLRAMIQATKADGQLDDAESQRLTRHIAEAGDDAEAQAFLRDEMARPVDIEGLAAQVRSPEEGAEVYAASVMAISVDTQAERDYLARLAQALRLPEPVVAHVHGSLKA